MTGLENLADELLVEIASYLSVDISRTGSRSSDALRNLTLCSRRLHHVGQALLYMNVALYKNESFLRLARTIMIRPELALLIRGVKAEIYDEDRYISTAEREIKEYIQNIVWVPSYWAEQWLRDCRSNRKGASLAVLLCLLPELSNLTIFVQCPPTYVTAAMRYGVKGLCQPLLDSKSCSRNQIHEFRFPRLSVLELASDNNVEIDFSAILHLSSLRRFCGDSLSCPARGLSIPHGISSLRELQITNGEMIVDDILPMLQACSGLRKFTFSWDQPWSDEDIMDDEWDFGVDVAPEIIKGVQQSKATLEHLDLSGRQPIRHDTKSLGSLTEFDHLHTLRIPAAMVVNPFGLSSERRTLHLLPTSLRKLHLLVSGAPKDILPSELLDCVQYEGWGSKLHTLTITWEDADVSESDGFKINVVARYELLKKACNERGIIFSFEMITRWSPCQIRVIG